MGGSGGKQAPAPQVIEVPAPVTNPENSGEVQDAHKREMQRLRWQNRQTATRNTGLQDQADIYKSTLG